MEEIEEDVHTLVRLQNVKALVCIIFFETVNIGKSFF